MRNLYSAFRNLIPEAALQVGTVSAVANNLATIDLPGGGSIKARGSATVGQTVFVRGNVIEGPAPSLPVEVIEI